MQPITRTLAAAALAIACASALSTPALRAQAGPYKILNSTKIGGEGGFDYIAADATNRRLYIPRIGPAGAVSVFNLDTLRPAGSIDKASGHGVAIDEQSQHAFTSSSPVAMWDARTLAPIKTIAVEGHPDGIFADPFNGRIYVFSHVAPNATVIDAKDGSIVGTIDLGGAPEQAVSDGKGHLYIDIEDKASVAVLDAATLKVTATYSLAGKGDGCAGLAIDTARQILFAACREPQNMVILSATDGKILAALPIGRGTDGAVFNPETREVFSSQGDGTLTIIKEDSPTQFSVEQTLTTLPRAKTLTLDPKTGKLYLMTAEFTPPPPPAPGERPGRGQMVPGSFTILTVGK